MFLSIALTRKVSSFIAFLLDSAKVAVFDLTIRSQSTFFAIKVSSAFYTFAHPFPLIFRGSRVV
jgi:hypothetical protein